MTRSRTIAAAVTAAVVVLLLVILLTASLSVSSRYWPPQPRTTDLVEVDEEFVDLFEPATRPSNPSPAYNATESRMQSTPDRAAGSDLADAGDAAAPDPTVVSERLSEVKSVKKDRPDRTGPDRKAQQEEKARRRARQGVSNAFSSKDEAEPDNTTSHGPAKGDSGSPTGEASDLSGTGHGSVGGGWIMPAYSKVKSHSTGSIELRAIVGSDGRVSEVTLVGGKAPASGDPALVARCINEVKRHRFTRRDSDAPERAVAKIIYNFR